MGWAEDEAAADKYILKLAERHMDELYADPEDEWPDHQGDYSGEPDDDWQ